MYINLILLEASNTSNGNSNMTNGQITASTEEVVATQENEAMETASSDTDMIIPEPEGS